MSNTELDQPPTAIPRERFRFSLGTLLLLITLIAIFCALWPREWWHPLQLSWVTVQIAIVVLCVVDQRKADWDHQFQVFASSINIIPCTILLIMMLSTRFGFVGGWVRLVVLVAYVAVFALFLTGFFLESVKVLGDLAKQPSGFRFAIVFLSAANIGLTAIVPVMWFLQI